MYRVIFVLVSLVVAWPTNLASAHYHIFLPDRASAALDKPVSLRIQFGHPFEHEFFSASRPESVVVLLPDGNVADLLRSLRETNVKGVDQKDVTAYQLEYKPEQRGDYVFVLTSVPLWMEAEQRFFQDTARVTLHVLTQKGWDNSLDKGFEMVPLTRPYGLTAGMVFQARAQLDGKPLPRALVEVERFNPVPPKVLPADEQITRKVKTGPNGIATCTLTEAGWWCVTVQRAAGMLARDGKMFPVRQRSTIWVFVDEASPTLERTK